MKDRIKKWLGIDKLYINSVDDHKELGVLTTAISNLDKRMDEATTTRNGERLNYLMDYISRDVYAIKEYLDIKIVEESVEDKRYTEMCKRFNLVPKAIKRKESK